MNFKDTLWHKIIIYGLEHIGRYYGNYRAFVHSNNDPLNMGRLQLIIPHINPRSVDDTWAWPVGQWGANGYGVQMLPQVGDMVWVSFEYGDLDYPSWKHAGYAENEKPVEFETPNHYGFKTPGGSLILINDNKDKERIFVKHNSSNEWIDVVKNQTELESKLIKLGKNGDEWAALGETLLKKLQDLTIKIEETEQALITHTHTSTSSGNPTSPPIQAANFVNLKTSIQNLRQTYEEILSKKVKVDK